MGPHQGRVEGKENLPWPAGHTPPNAPQESCTQCSQRDGLCLSHQRPWLDAVLSWYQATGFLPPPFRSDSWRHSPSYLYWADHCAKGKYGGRIPQGGLAVEGPLRVHQQHCNLRGRKLHVSLEAPVQHLHPSKITLKRQRGWGGVNVSCLTVLGISLLLPQTYKLVEDTGKEQPQSLLTARWLQQAAKWTLGNAEEATALLLQYSLSGRMGLALSLH